VDFNRETGLLFVDAESFKSCFDGFDVAILRDREGYSNNWYDVDDQPFWDESTETTLEFVIPELDGDLYLQVETYMLDAVPTRCVLGTDNHVVPNYGATYLQNGKVVHQSRRLPYMIPYQYVLSADSADYAAGDVITVKIDYAWARRLAARDFSLVVYSKQDITIYDADRKQNQLRYDGQRPSGLTASSEDLAAFNLFE